MAEPEAPAQTTAPIVFKKRTAKSTLRKRAPSTSPPPATSTKSDSSSDSDNDETLPSFKRPTKRRRGPGLSGSTSTKEAPIANPNDLRSSTAAASTTKTLSDPSTDATATSHMASAKAAPPSGGKTVGPARAPANVRQITLIDFAPDVCKDYKQTGFCGFGDSCKFLHAREDYKQGWELDREWERQGNRGADNSVGGAGTVVSSAGRARRLRAAENDADGAGGGVDEDDSDAADAALLEGIPFACVICKKPYRQPITTRCGHYFCGECARTRYRRRPDCAACGEDTGGMFNQARNLMRILKRRRERRARRREEGREAEGGEWDGEGVQSDDE